MAFEQKYDDATREAATARVLQRLATNPKDRHVFTVVADEFSVGQQSLRAWVAVAKAATGTPARKKSRPRFSPVVTTKAERLDDQRQQAPLARPEAPESPHEDAGSDMLPLTPASPRPAATTSSDPAHLADAAALEAEVVALREGNETLKAAMRVLLKGS